MRGLLRMLLFAAIATVLQGARCTENTPTFRGSESPKDAKIYVYRGTYYAIYRDERTGKQVVARRIDSVYWQKLNDPNFATTEAVINFGKYEFSINQADIGIKLSPPRTRAGEGVRRNVYLEDINRDRGGSEGGAY